MRKNEFSGVIPFFNKHGINGIFKVMVDNNLMCHQEMIDSLAFCVRENNSAILRIIDLGCGPAFHIAESFYGKKPISYTGIDVSVESLRAAQANVGIMPNLKQSIFLDTDILDGLKKQIELGCCYNLALSSYALHHFTLQNKKTFFELVFSVLLEAGELYLIDIINLKKTREDWINLVKKYIINTGKFSSDMFEDFMNHVIKYDFPETLETLRKLGIDAGFKNSEVRYVLPEKEKIYTFIRFQK